MAKSSGVLSVRQNEAPASNGRSAWLAVPVLPTTQHTAAGAKKQWPAGAKRGPAGAKRRSGTVESHHRIPSPNRWSHDPEGGGCRPRFGRLQGAAGSASGAYHPTNWCKTVAGAPSCTVDNHDRIPSLLAS